jgi:hypothetical protein
VRPVLRAVPVYLTPRGYVAADELTAVDMFDVAVGFRLADCHHLSEPAFGALCDFLGLEMVRVGRSLLGRVPTRRAA